MKDRRAAAWRMLTPAEKDALIVLTAMCKVGCRPSRRLLVWVPLMSGNTDCVWLVELCLGRFARGHSLHSLPTMCLPCPAPNPLSPAPTAARQMAARETGFGAVEGYMHQGKLLALDLLVRVLTNPMHDWAHMRPEFAGG